jgi:hypothetical protein
MKVRFWSTELRITSRSILFRLRVLSAYCPSAYLPTGLLPTDLLQAVEVGPQCFRDDD